MVQFSRASLFGSPAVEPQRHAAAAVLGTNRVTVPQLKERLSDSQTAGVMYSSSLLAICCSEMSGGACGAVSQRVKNWRRIQTAQ